MEELFTVIGKMYMDLYNAQKLIQNLKEELETTKEENNNLRQSRTEDE